MVCENVEKGLRNGSCGNHVAYAHRAVGDARDRFFPVRNETAVAMTTTNQPLNRLEFSFNKFDSFSA